MTRSTLPLALLFAATIGGAALAACGGPGPGPQVPGTSTAPGTASVTASTTPSGAPSPTPSGTASGAPSATASGSATPNAISNAPPFHGPMKPIRASQMTGELQALGLDPKNLPPLMKLEPPKMRKVMTLFAKSMGGKCLDCHVDGDFAAPTPRKKVAEKMWDVFVRQLAFADDKPLFCDSCHQGSFRQLDRTDKKALAKWMGDNFDEQLKRKDGQDHGCESPQCHGSSMDQPFLMNWAK